MFLTPHCFAWLVYGHSVEIVQYHYFCFTLGLTIGALLTIKCCAKFALEICIIFSV